MKLALWTIAALACSAFPARASGYAIGADLSFVKQAEDRGIRFKEDGQPRPALEMFRSHGYNWIRLRLFHTPTQLPNNLEYTIALARDAKRLGFQFLLDYHYSDTWADPGKQIVPKAWEGMPQARMVEALFQYTRDTTAAFRDAGALPDMVQIGNEVSNGMLWPAGKLPANWDNFAAFLKAGIAGVEAGSGNAPRPRIMIHIDKGGDRIATKAFFDRLNACHVDFDVIGQSYYPWWQGSLDDLRDNMIFTAKEYGKDIMVVEAAYNWTPGNYRTRPGPFPETPQGQKEFLDEVNRVVQSTSDGRGAGVFWWEPAVAGGTSARGFFDRDFNVLPVITVFDKFTRH